MSKADGRRFRSVLPENPAKIIAKGDSPKDKESSSSDQSDDSVSVFDNSFSQSLTQRTPNLRMENVRQNRSFSNLSLSPTSSRGEIVSGL